MENLPKVNEYCGHNEYSKIDLYLIINNLSKLIKREKGLIKDIPFRWIEGDKYFEDSKDVKFIQTKYGDIKECIVLEKIAQSKNADLINANKILLETKNIISAIEALKSISWGR